MEKDLTVKELLQMFEKYQKAKLGYIGLLFDDVDSCGCLVDIDGTPLFYFNSIEELITELKTIEVKHSSDIGLDGFMRSEDKDKWKS